MFINVSIPNTTITLNDAGDYYNITPNENYVLHDSNYDEVIFDEETGEEIGLILGYRTTTAGVFIRTYDFTPHEMQDEAGNTVIAYGRRNFYTKLASDVPADQIYSGGNTNTPEIM